MPPQVLNITHLEHARMHFIAVEELISAEDLRNSFQQWWRAHIHSAVEYMDPMEERVADNVLDFIRLSDDSEMFKQR